MPKTTLPPMPSTDLAPLRAGTDFGLLDSTSLAPAQPSAWDQSERRLSLERGTNNMDRLGAMWRQDGLTDGALAWLASTHIQPDPNYNPLADTSLAELEKGIRPDLVPELYKATSKAHANFLRDRLLQKQADQDKLETLGTLGEVGRFAVGALMPENLAAAAVTGGASYAVRGVRAARAAKLAKDASTLAKMEAAAGLAAQNAAGGAGTRGLIGAVGLGAAENAGLERLRQNLNYEQDTSAVVASALMGAGISFPFALRGSRAASKAADQAFKDVEAIRALRKLEEGTPLSAAETTTLREVHDATRLVHDLETGKVTPEDAEKALEGFHGPQEPDAHWLSRLSERMREDSDSWLTENLAGMSSAEHAKDIGRSRKASAAADAERAARGAVDNSPVPPLPVENAPLETALGSAFRKSLDERTKRLAAAQKAEDARAARKGLLSAEDAAWAERQASEAVARKADREAAWKAAEADHAEALRMDEERAHNERQLQLAEQDPLHVPAPEATAGAPEAPPVAHPHEKWAGREVSWQGPEGDTLEGTVLRYNPEIGKLIVQTPDGPKAVLADKLDQYEGHVPEGFVRAESAAGQSVGAAQVKGTQINSAATQETALRKLRFDYFALLNGSPLKTVRSLASKLMKDALQTDKYDAQAASASELKDRTRRIIAGAFHVERQAAFDAAVKDMKVSLWNRDAFSDDFHTAVTRAVNDPLSVQGLPKELQAHVQKAAGAAQQFYARMLKEAQAAGVKGAEHVKPDDLYTNRMWHQGQMRKLAQDHGDEALYTLLAAAIKDKPGVLERMRKKPGVNEERDTLTNKVTNPGKTDDELLRMKAKGFLQAVKALEFSPALRDASLGGRDMGTLRRELRAMGVDDGHVDDLVDLLFERREASGGSDAGRMENLKFRFQLDPSTTVETPKGTLRISDLWEQDIRVLVDHYAQGMSGRIGLAKHGITSDSDWARMLQAVADEGKVNLEYDTKRIAADVQRLQDVYNHIVGRPMSDQAFSFANRSASVLRAYTRSVMLPQLGIAAFFEMNKAVAMFGFRNMLSQMPSLRGFITALRQGHLPDTGLAQQVRLMSGFGSELAGHYARSQEIADGFFGQSLGRVENAANKLSHWTDRLSGNASLTSMTKQWAALGALQDFSNHAHGRKLDAKKTQRWVGQGISEDDLPDVMAAFKAHTERDPSGAVTSIHYEKWQATDPRTYETFQTFLSRQAREAIQDHDIGESAPFMHGPIGKIFGELKTFFLVGHAKNFLKQAFHADATAAQVFTIGFIAEALAYSTQTAINFPGELDTRLTAEKVATAAYFRMASLGTASMLTEMAYNFATGGDSLVQPGMTANTDIRSMWNTASLTVLRRAGNASSTLPGMVFGTDVTTKKEAQDLVGLVPVLGRMYGINGLLQAWAADHPLGDPSKVRTP